MVKGWNDEGKAWAEKSRGNNPENNVGDSRMVAARFMEIDGKLADIGGDVGGIKIVSKFQEREKDDNYVLNLKRDMWGMEVLKIMLQYLMQKKKSGK